MAFDLSKLANVKNLSDGWQAQCPICAREGHDLKGKNHLRLYKSGAFNCAVHNGDIHHNREIRALLKGYESEADVEYIVPEPELKADRVYPDSVLAKVIPDHSYWRGRGMKDEVVSALEGGLAPESEKGPLAGRSVFPLRNPSDQIVAFTGRLVIENSLAKRWKHFGPVSHVVWPFNISGPEIERTKTAILLEGPGDTIACLSNDIKPVICLFGLNLFDLTIATLVGAGVNRVFISLNKDLDPRKGQAAAEKIARKLFPFISDIRIRLPKTSKDWGESILTEAGRADMDGFKEEIEAL